MSYSASRKLEPRSQFFGHPLAYLLACEGLNGGFDDDVWDIGKHPQAHSMQHVRRIRFDSYPVHLRQLLKEYLALAVNSANRPAGREVLGVRERRIPTIFRQLAELVIDLSWLKQRAGALRDVRDEDYVAWRDDSELAVDYRRVSALKSLFQLEEAMSPELDRLRVEPFPGLSARKVMPRKIRRSNVVRAIPIAEYAPILLGAMTIVENATTLLAHGADRSSTEALDETRIILTNGSEHTWRPSIEAGATFGAVAGASMVVTAAFTGMRLSELISIPRDSPLEQIDIDGATRWLLRSWLHKGLKRPRRETWVVPPIVQQAVTAMQLVAHRLNLSGHHIQHATGEAPLFDREALLRRFDRQARSPAMRFARAVEMMLVLSDDLASSGIVPAVRNHRALNPRESRVTFAHIVAGRPHGPEAAMQHFKWQSPQTAMGYFRAAPEGVSLSQRELYEDIKRLYGVVVVDSLSGEYHLWRERLQKSGSSFTPAGPDGRRKRDMFEAVRAALESGPQVVEDDRKLRQLLQSHASSLTLTEYGWCDFNPDFALCGTEDGPLEARCKPNQCINHSTPAWAVGAHVLKRDRLLLIAKDRHMPSVAREQAAANVAVIEKDLGEVLGMTA